MSRIPTRPYCLGTPSMYKCAMVKIDSQEQMVACEYTGPFILEASYLDVRGKGQVIGPAKVKFDSDRTLHFVRSDKFDGWYYIVAFIPSFQQWGCSCAESKLQGFCKHLGLVTTHTEVIVA